MDDRIVFAKPTSGKVSARCVFVNKLTSVVIQTQSRTANFNIVSTIASSGGTGRRRNPKCVCLWILKDRNNFVGQLLSTRDPWSEILPLLYTVTSLVRRLPVASGNADEGQVHWTTCDLNNKIYNAVMMSFRWDNNKSINNSFNHPEMAHCWLWTYTYLKVVAEIRRSPERSQVNLLSLLWQPHYLVQCLVWSRVPLDRCWFSWLACSSFSSLRSWKSTTRCNVLQWIEMIGTCSELRRTGE